MYLKLKSLKIVNISLNGCVYFDYSVYLKTFKKYKFLEKNLASTSSNKKKSVLVKSNFFYRKYRN